MILFGNMSGNGTGNGTGLGLLNGTGFVTPGMGTLPLDGPIEPMGEMYPMLLSDPGFADSWWDPALRAQLVLAEFAATTKWRDIQVHDPVNTENNLQLLIASLLKLRVERWHRAAEILAQSDSFVGYWYQLLGAESGLRPYTAAIVQVGVAIGQLVGMHFKYKFKRVRPAHLYPALMPLVPTPRHPSYPSNHALQSRLIALALDAAMPEELRKTLGKDRLLGDLAYRIGYNREIAGVHYSDDSTAGRLLAEDVFLLLRDVPSFKTLCTDASDEWANFKVLAAPPPPAIDEGERT